MPLAAWLNDTLVSMEAAPKPNAFTVLRQGAKRRKSSAPSVIHAADSQVCSCASDSGTCCRHCAQSLMYTQSSSYVGCPLCGASMPRLLIQNHVESCQGKSTEPLCLDSKEMSGHQAEVTDKETEVMLQQQQHKQQQQQQQQQSEISMQLKSAEATAVNNVTAKSTAGNAFSALMAEQRQRSRVVSLHLEHASDNTWQVHCWTKGAASKCTADASSASHSQSDTQEGKSRMCSPAAWSAQTQISSSVMEMQEASASSSVAAKLTFQLQTNVPSEAGGDAAQLAQPNLAASAFTGSASLLKSALQKNVRLCRVAPAVRCAAKLLLDSPADFLRRVSIICLEDALLHPSLPVLVWLMCAQAKGYVLGRDTAMLCLRIVHQLAAVPVRDHVSEETMHPPNAGQHGSQKMQLEDEEAVLVQSILIRAAYGGMAGDVRMLQGFADSWNSRFRGVTNPPKLMHENSTSADGPATWLGYLKSLYDEHDLTTEQLGVILTTPVRYSDIPLSAVDFHISSIVEELLQRPQILEAAETLCCNCKDRDAAAVLKRAMWLFRSGLNLKKVVSDSLNTKQEDEKLVLHQLWTASQACADAWSSGYLRRRFTVS